MPVGAKKGHKKGKGSKCAKASQKKKGRSSGKNSRVVRGSRRVSTKGKKMMRQMAAEMEARKEAEQLLQELEQFARVVSLDALREARREGMLPIPSQPELVRSHGMTLDTEDIGGIYTEAAGKYGTFSRKRA